VLRNNLMQGGEKNGILPGFVGCIHSDKTLRSF
jgi:hypothetical protein